MSDEGANVVIRAFRGRELLDEEEDSVLDRVP